MNECRCGFCVVCVWLKRQDLKAYAMDFIDTFSNQEIAQMVREGVLTVEEAETGLRRRMSI